VTLLLSIHDVTPALAAEVRTLHAMCARIGAEPALLVVPDWHGEWPLERHPRFVEWLASRAAAGAEIVLHGERHDEVGSPRGWSDALRAWGRTAREGEFLTLAAAAAHERIARGRDRLQALGLAPIGFVPPAWLCREATHNVVGALGFRFSEDARGLRIHPSGRRLRAPAVCWSARSALRARGSAVVAEVRWQLQRGAPVVRLALHPGDLRHRAAVRSIERALERWPAEHPIVRYLELTA
jgi:predicted deacetylase